MKRALACMVLLAAVLLPTAASAQSPDDDYNAYAGRSRASLLVELAQILGEAHAIRSLCNGDGDQTWRNYMVELMRVEAGNVNQSSLTSSFNRGYRAQRQRKACTAELVGVEQKLAGRGRVLADVVARSYVN